MELGYRIDLPFKSTRIIVTSIDLDQTLCSLTYGASPGGGI